MQQLQRAFGYASSMQQLDGFQRNAWRLLGGFGQHRVAGGQRGCDLPHKDRQRKVPRADADPGAACGQGQLVAFTGDAQQGVAGKTRHDLRLHDALGLLRVVAQKVDGFAHLTDCVTPGLEGLLDQQGAKARQLALQRIGGTAQHGGTLCHRHFAPCLIAGSADGQSAGGQFGIKLWHLRHLHDCISCQQRVTHGGHGQVKPGAVGALQAKQIGRQRQRRMGFEPQR